MNVLSLFSGIAGLDLGLKIAVPAARTVCYVENDGYCQRVLAARMSDGSLDPAPIHGDVRSFDGRPWRGCVDTICGGFPCQDISNAGRREGIHGERSGLWFEFARIIGEVEPRYVFVENVAALLVRGLDTVLGSLAEMGFTAEWGIVSAADVGAPHLRKRLFVLAYANADDRERASGVGPGPGEATGGGPRGRASGRGLLLADAANERYERAGPPRGGWCGSPHHREPLADAEGQRGELWTAEGGRSWRSASGGSAMGHADDEGLEGRRLRQCGRADEWPPGQTGLPGFPPGPAERDAWAAILAEWPELAPAVEPTVCLVDDGLSHRVAQLKACGNAVVALQAALGFRLLAERIAQ